MLHRTATTFPATAPDVLTDGRFGPLDRFAVRHADTLLLLARLALGVIFVQSGFGKLMGLDAFAASLAKNGVPAPTLLAPIGAAVEFLGGVAIVLGLRVRAAALVMIAFVVVATLISHRFWEFEGAARQTQSINFFKNLTIIGGFLALFVAGPGGVSVDRALDRPVT